MNSKEPLVSVVVPAYNRAQKLEAAIKSIQAQTYSNLEVIIADDGSQDDTKAVVQRLMAGDSRVRYVHHEINQGAQAARNTGIRAAKGEWIAFLDSDDAWLPESLRLRVDRALAENVDVIYSGAMIRYEGKSPEVYHLPEWRGNIYTKVISREGPMFQSLLVRKAALEKIGLLDENITAYQEWDTAIRLAKHYQFGFEPEPTFIYDYTSKDAISRDCVRAGRGYEQILKKIFWDALWTSGPGTIAFHYERMANWFKDGGDSDSWRRYQGRAKLWKLLSPRDVLGKLRGLLASRKN